MLVLFVPLELIVHNLLQCQLLVQQVHTNQLLVNHHVYLVKLDSDVQLPL